MHALVAARESATFDITGLDELERRSEAGERQLVAIWHEAALLALAVPTRLAPLVFITGDRAADGVAEVSARLGLRVIREPAGALRTLERARAELSTPGTVLVLAVDGPAGPPRRVKPGILWLAQRTGALVVPCGLNATRYTVLETWDRQKLPRPGATIRGLVGDPFSVGPERGSRAAAQTELADRLDRLTEICS
jgi:lysophospholipid acyltransferase (LPLAT)-like uncharacterized protein